MGGVGTMASPDGHPTTREPARMRIRLAVRTLAEPSTSCVYAFTIARGESHRRMLASMRYLEVGGNPS